MSASPVASNYQGIVERIEQAALRAGRSPSEVRLVVVTKTYPSDSVRPVIEAGACYLGESYVEEAGVKVSDIGPQPGLEWHMIGHVQSRKARQVCEYFDYLHSLDRLKLARLLDRFAGEAGRRLPVLLECNVSGEESKYGWPAWDEGSWPELLPAVEEIVQLPHLEVRGLMTMAPFLHEPEQTRPYFLRLRRLRDYLQEHFPGSCWSELSMGMSADFEVAIEEGATWVRVGTAIMGERN